MTQFTYTFHQLRDGFQFKDDATFTRRLADLTAKHGFPQPLPGTPRRWSKSAVNDWLANWNGPTVAITTRAVGISPEQLNSITAMRSALAETFKVSA